MRGDFRNVANSFGTSFSKYEPLSNLQVLWMLDKPEMIMNDISSNDND